MWRSQYTSQGGSKWSWGGVPGESGRSRVLRYMLRYVQTVLGSPCCLGWPMSTWHLRGTLALRVAPLSLSCDRSPSIARVKQQPQADQLLMCAQFILSRHKVRLSSSPGKEVSPPSSPRGRELMMKGRAGLALCTCYHLVSRAWKGPTTAGHRTPTQRQAIGDGSVCLKPQLSGE